LLEASAPILKEVFSEHPVLDSTSLSLIFDAISSPTGLDNRLNDVSERKEGKIKNDFNTITQELIFGSL
jgi:hypothetical protein